MPAKNLRTRAPLDYVDRSKYLKAIACVDVNGRDEFKKYHNIADDTVRRERFENFIRKKFPGCKHVNYYFANGNFKMQVKLRSVGS